MAIVTCRQ